MAYRRTGAPSTRGRTAGTRFRQPARRRRYGVAMRARMNRSAYAQSKQIQSLARLAVRNARVLNGQRLYTDYYLNGQTDGTWTANVWQVFSILDPISWQQTLRRNNDADNAQNAYVRNMFFQYTCGLNTLKSSGTVTLMLASVRPNAAAFVPSSTSMSNGEEYQNLGSYQMPIVNSGLLKVKWSKTFVVQSNGLGGPSIAQTSSVPIGDPSDSFVRGSVNMTIRTTFRSPSMFIAPAAEPQAWSTLTDKDIKPSQRLYLMAWYQSQDGQNTAGLNWSAKFTVITSN